MPDGYGFFTFGWIQAEREAAWVNRFDERWHRLRGIHQQVTSGFIEPIIAVGELLTGAEAKKLGDDVHEATDWCSTINANIKNARQNRWQDH